MRESVGEYLTEEDLARGERAGKASMHITHNNALRAM